MATVIQRIWVFLRYFYWRLSQRKFVERGFVPSRASRIFYQRTGSGPALVLLHGGYVQLEAFAAQIPSFSSSFSVIAIDTRGHGRSSHDVRRLSYASFADDVVEVLKQLRISYAYFMGWSDGANTCVELALNHPDVVKKMVLVSANYHTEGLKPKKDSKAAQLFLRPTLYSLYALFSPHPKEWDKLDSQLQRLWQHEPNHTLESLARIEAPTLVIGGEFDYIHESHFKEMATAIPGARLSIIPNARHDPHITHAKFFNQQVLAFLQDNRTT